MKKKLITAILITTIALLLSACGNSSSESKEDAVKNSAESTAKTDSKEGKDTQDDVDAADETFESIFDNYSQEIKDTAAVLVEEYNTEAAEIEGDNDALYELSITKLYKLTEIFYEGTTKMTELVLKYNGDEDASTEWGQKLEAVYDEQAQLIEDAYENAKTD